jgi:PAS domain S-box-containing protein
MLYIPIGVNPGMKDKYKTKTQLINELTIMRRRVGELEGSEVKPGKGKETTRYSENEYQALLKNSGDAIIVADSKGTFLEVNRKAEYLLGYKREELLCMNPRNIIPKSEFKRIMHDFSRIAAGEIYLCYDSKVLRKDGKLISVDITAATFEYNGRTLIQCIFRDITDRKLAEEALRKSEERFRELVEFLPEAVFEIDIKGFLTFGNRKAFDIFGYVPEDFADDLYVFDMIVPGDRDRAFKNIQRIINGEDISPNEYMLQRKDGSVFPSIIRLAAIFRDGKPAGFRGFIIDITERKQTEEKQRHSEKLTAALEMAGAICHELNQPLQVIGGRIEILSMINKDYSTLEILEIMKNQVQKMGIITKKLMGLKMYSNRDYAGNIKITDIHQTHEDDT